MESDNDSVSSIASDERARHESESSEEDIYEQFNRNLQPAKDNNPNVTELLGRGDNERIKNFTDEEWVETGLALSKNTHLDTLQFGRNALNDHKMSLLFRGLTISRSIKNLYLHENGLKTGIESMLPFLQNASNLVTLDLDGNSIQSEEFNFLLVALCDSPVKELHCCGCNIESIQIDNARYPTKLKDLRLFENRINEDGCRGLAKLLQMPDCALKNLSLGNNNIDDAGVALFANALQYNTTLTALYLYGNKGISKEGNIMMLKLVNDISSVKATLQSNHTLHTIYLDNGDYDDIMVQNQMNEFTTINAEYSNNAEAAGKEKMIRFQLHSDRRSALAELQKVHQSVYSEISPIYLPELLSLVGPSHGQGELFAAVKSSIAVLMSIVNRKKRIKVARDYFLARAEQLTAEPAAIGTEEGNEIDESHRSKRRKE